MISTVLVYYVVVISFIKISNFVKHLHCPKNKENKKKNLDHFLHSHIKEMLK